MRTSRYLPLLTIALLALLRPAFPALAAAEPPAAPAAPAAAAAPVSKAAPAATVSYYGVFMQQAKIGSMVLRSESVPAAAGKPAAQRSVSELTLSLKVLGSDAVIKNTSTSLTDARTGLPLSSESRTEGGGRTSTVTATYTESAVNYVANIDGSATQGSLKLGPGEHFLADVSSMPGFVPRAGLKMKGKQFAAESLKLVDDEIEVGEKEPVTVGGQTVTAYRVVDVNSVSGKTTSYMNEAGDLLLSDAPLGMKIVRMPKAEALADADGPAPDLAAAMSIAPSGEPLKAPRDTVFAKYALTGVTRRLPDSDGVQSVSYSGTPAVGAPVTATITVTAHPLPPAGGTLYAKPEDAPAAFQPYLKPTVYVQSDKAPFPEVAKQVVGTETDAARAAAKIAAWAHAKVKPDPGIAAVRTAADVYSDPRGVCRDYTVLFTAVARAAGLPTKQCVGVVCADGRFFYHAWPEVYVGAAGTTAPDGWVALEPTFGAPFADATHIKLAEGEIGDIGNVAADVGKYGIDVLSVTPSAPKDREAAQ